MSDATGEISRSIKSVPLSFQGPRKQYEVGGGPCDLSGKNDKNSMVEWRFSKLLWTLSVAGGFGTIAQDTQRFGFRRGVGDDGTDAGYIAVPLRESETNLLAQGSLNNAKEGLFVGRSFGVIFDEPYNFVTPSGQKTYDQFKHVYAQQFIRALGETISMAINNRDDAVQRFITLPQFWPSYSSMSGDGNPTVGTPWGPATMVPFNDDYKFYDDNRGNATEIIATLPREVRLVEDPANVLPAAFSCAMTLVIFGGPVDAIAACGPDARTGSSAEKVAMVRELMAGGMSAGDAARTTKELMG